MVSTGPEIVDRHDLDVLAASNVFRDMRVLPLRPMRPNPLIATQTAISSPPLFGVAGAPPSTDRLGRDAEMLVDRSREALPEAPKPVMPPRMRPCAPSQRSLPNPSQASAGYTNCAISPPIPRCAMFTALLGEQLPRRHRDDRRRRGLPWPGVARAPSASSTSEPEAISRIGADGVAGQDVARRARTGCGRGGAPRMDARFWRGEGEPTGPCAPRARAACICSLDHIGWPQLVHVGDGAQRARCSTG